MNIEYPNWADNLLTMYVPPLYALKMIYQDLEKEMSMKLSSQLCENIILVPDIINRLENISEKVLSTNSEHHEIKKGQFFLSKENIVELTERAISEKNIELSSKKPVRIQLSCEENKIFVEIDKIEYYARAF